MIAIFTLFGRRPKFRTSDETKAGYFHVIIITKR